MLDIIKNKIDLNDFIQVIKKEHNLETHVFDIIEMVFNNSEYLPYLEIIYKELNKRDLNILQTIKNKSNQTIYELYKSIQCEDEILNEHITKYVNSNIGNILSLFNMPKKHIKSFNDILIERIDKLEKDVEELKIRISNKDFIS